MFYFMRYIYVYIYTYTYERQNNRSCYLIHITYCKAYVIYSSPKVCLHCTVRALRVKRNDCCARGGAPKAGFRIRLFTRGFIICIYIYYEL